MNPKSELCLTQVFSPFSLLLCKNALYQLEAGEEIEVLMGDPEAISDLTRIIERSTDRILYKTAEDGYFRIRIQKGPSEFRK